MFLFVISSPKTEFRFRILGNDCNLRKTIKNERIMIVQQRNWLNGFSVHRQKLRERTSSPQPRQTCPGTACCTPIASIDKSKENIGHHINYQPIRQSINWLKYNILVSIYDNWLRLEPFISYWLSRTFQQKDTKDPEIKDYLKNAKKKEGLPPKAQKQQAESILNEMRNRRKQLLRNILPSTQDVQNLTKATQLARQLLNTLPLENQKWSKARIQNHNRIIEDMIKNFSQQQFEKNSDAIMHSIKERIYFIDQMQRKFISYSKQQKNKLSQKIQLLKQPFQKAFNMSKNSKIQPQKLFQNLWLEIQDQRAKIMQSNENLRSSYKQKRRNQNHRVAIIQKPDTGGLIIKYQLKHGDYYNQPYNRAKSRHRKGKQRGKHAMDSINECMNEENQSATKDSAENQQTPSSNSQIDINADFEKEEINNKFVEDFMKRQKLKHAFRDQSTNFFKKNTSKFENNSHYRPSISYIDNMKSSKDGDFSSQKQRMSTTHERTSVLGRRASRSRPSGQQITQKQDHMSRFKSHKKIITMKNIGGAKYTRINRDQNKHIDIEQPSIARISAYVSKNQKKQYRRERVDVRKGHCYRKGAHNRKQLENNDQTSNQTSIDFLHLNRQQFLNYFNKILLSGVLDSQKYDQLRERVQNLIKSNEPSALFENHAFVQKLIGKSVKNDYSCLIGEGRQATLFNLYEVICKDESIRAKIRDQMKIMLDDMIVKQCCSSQSINNERFLFHSTQLRKVNQQLKRILNFQTQNQTISFANRLIRESNKLKQSSF